ncbi:MAG: EFR1 family ferrodoxin [Oscillospiraceae bacterium]|jgi:ferredoxin|nr:EFR1 family ferrodoxin [Oscillospiraceae bacterium]
MSNLIYVFTGTGNSLYAAKKIAAALGDTQICLMRNVPAAIGTHERIGFVFPCFGAGAPQAVIDFVRKLDITPHSANYFFAVATAGDSGANSIPMLWRELERKGIVLDYGADVQTVGNYIALYRMSKHPEPKLIAANEKAEKIAQQIAGGVRLGKNAPVFHFRPLSVAFYKIANNVFAAKGKKLCVTDACTSCGLCAKLCPVENIRMVGSKPNFTYGKCAQCMACVQWCPKAAIECGKSTVGRTRWHNPDIKAEELYK